MTKSNQKRTTDVRMACLALSHFCIYVWQLFVLVTRLVLSDMLWETQTQTLQSPVCEILQGLHKNTGEVKGKTDLCLIKHHAIKAYGEAEV